MSCIPIKLIHGDVLEILDQESIKEVKAIFADPPDNIGLNYSGFNDSRPIGDYYNWLELLIMKSLRKTSTFWLSIYHEHLMEVMFRARNILKYRYPSFELKLFIWRFTFGQHNQFDCGSGFRPILRFKRTTEKILTEQIRVESQRMRIGDSRANPIGRVPDDVFDFPRVVGNAKERRAWHPTQHPEALIDRIVRMSCLLPTIREPILSGNNNDSWGNQVFMDLFAGSGTSIRVCKRLRVPLITAELSGSFISELLAEHPNIEFYSDCTLMNNTNV